MSLALARTSCRKKSALRTGRTGARGRSAPSDAARQAKQRAAPSHGGRGTASRVRGDGRVDCKLGSVPHGQADSNDVDAPVVQAVDRGIQIAYKGVGCDTCAGLAQQRAAATAQCTRSHRQLRAVEGKGRCKRRGTAQESRHAPGSSARW